MVPSSRPTLHEAVHVARRLLGDHALAEVAPHERAVARARVAVAAGAGGDDGDRLPVAEEALRPHGRLHAGAVHDLAAAALPAAEQPPRRRAAARAVDEGV